MIPAPAHWTLQSLSLSSGSGCLFFYLSVSSFSPFFFLFLLSVCLSLSLCPSVFFYLSCISLLISVCVFFCLSDSSFSLYPCLSIFLSVSSFHLSLFCLSVLSLCIFVSFSVCTLVKAELGNEVNDMLCPAFRRRRNWAVKWMKTWLWVNWLKASMHWWRNWKTQKKVAGPCTVSVCIFETCFSECLILSFRCLNFFLFLFSKSVPIHSFLWHRIAGK